jgi:hypothetical protein
MARQQQRQAARKARRDQNSHELNSSRVAGVKFSWTSGLVFETRPNRKFRRDWMRSMRRRNDGRRKQFPKVLS